MKGALQSAGAPVEGPASGLDAESVGRVVSGAGLPAESVGVSVMLGLRLEPDA